MDRRAKVFVAGHKGIVGRAIMRRLTQDGFTRLITVPRQRLDLRDQAAVEEYFSSVQPDVVVIAAAKVGGIAANIAQPVEFLVENLAIQTNLLMACQRHGAQRVMFLGSSCVYPRKAPQPMREEYFMTGPLEPTNESYAVAKIAGIRLAQALARENGLSVVCPMPCNVYGPGDHFEFERAHVVSSLVRRFVDAHTEGVGEVSVWGSGAARREFLHVDDLADASLFLLDNYDSADLINVGSGVDYSILDLANMIAELVGFKGEVRWDTSKPDGMPQKLLDVTRLERLGWCSQIPLETGLRSVIADYRSRVAFGSTA